MKSVISSNIVTKQQLSNSDMIKSEYYNYYDSRLKIRETFETNKKIENNNFSTYELTNDNEKILQEVLNPIQRLFFLIRNDYDILLKIIDSFENSKDNFESVVELIGHQFYGNLLIQNPEHEDLLILCYKLIFNEIDTMSSAQMASFLDENGTFIGKLLKSYTKRQDLKTFLTMIFGDIILSIENNNESCLDLDISRITSYAKDKKQAHISKLFSNEKSKNLLAGIDNENLGNKIRRSTLVKKNEFMFSQGSSGKNRFLDTIQKDEFILEEVDDIKELKIEEDDTFNNDYRIEITQDELCTRFATEENENMREFCKDY
jgi:hypothetical protein